MEEANLDFEAKQRRNATLSRALVKMHSGEFTDRRSALQIELAMGLVHFAQETTSPRGKSSLKIAIMQLDIDAWQKSIGITRLSTGA